MTNALDKISGMTGYNEDDEPTTIASRLIQIAAVAKVEADKITGRDCSDILASDIQDELVNLEEEAADIAAGF